MTWQALAGRRSTGTGRRPLSAWKLSSRVHSSEDDCVSAALSNQLDIKRFICAADAEEQRVCHWTSNRSQNEPKPTPLGRTWSYVGPSNHFQAATDIQLTDPLRLQHARNSGLQLGSLGLVLNGFTVEHVPVCHGTACQ